LQMLLQHYHLQMQRTNSHHNVWPGSSHMPSQLQLSTQLALCFQEQLKYHDNVETRFYCPQIFLYLDSQCRDDVSELK